MSCKCAKVSSQSTDELLNHNPKITQVLSDKQLVVIDDLLSIDVYKIVKQLVNGTKDRYSNRNEFVKKLDEKEWNYFFSLVLNDANYDWDFDKNLPFDPSAQVLLKGANHQFMFLFSESTGQMSIIDIEGQQVFKIKDKLIEYFKNI